MTTETPTKPVEIDIYGALPLAVLDVLDRYLRHGTWPGDGIGAVLRNDLRGTLEHIDDWRVVKTLLRYLVNRCPAASWGSAKLVETWCTTADPEARKRAVANTAHAVYLERRRAAER